jgi:predicted RNase H-like nuclease (RuvC/YqgF family)
MGDKAETRDDSPEPKEDGLTELKHNLKVSFSRMKEDIHFNRQQVEDLLKANRMLLEQLGSLKEEIKALKGRPQGLKNELMRGLSRNRKKLIKQRLLGLIEEGKYSIPELKEIVVDEKNYCSKASFYRYIEELKKRGNIAEVEAEGGSVLRLAKGQEQFI